MKFSIFPKKEGMTEEEQKDYDKKKNLISLGGYLLFFVIIIIYVNLMPKTPINNEKENLTPKSETNISEMLEKINTNYKEKITITENLKDYTLEREKQDTKEVGIFSEGENIINYVYDGTNYYTLNETDGLKINNDIKLLKDYDETFLNIENIKKLINESKEEVDITEEKYKIKRYKTTLSELVTVYNGINNTLHAINQNSDIIINVNYNETIEGIDIDLTDFYKIVLKKEVDQMLYKIEYSQIGKINLADLENVTNYAN